MQLPSDYIIIRGNLSKANRQREICFILEKKRKYAEPMDAGQGSPVFSLTLHYFYEKVEDLVRV